MGMAANMAAIVPAALLEHGTRAGKLVYCMFHVYHGPSTRDLCHLFGILGKGIEWIDAPAPRGWAAGSGPPSSGLLCFMFIRPGTLCYTCLRRQGNEAESDVAAPGGFRSRVNEPAFYRTIPVRDSYAA
jgi:hypothetical protein